MKHKKMLLTLQIMTGFYTALWVVIHLLHESPESGPTTLFSSTIILLALFGGIFGLKAAKDWGGFSSTLGKALSYLSIGLLLNALGEFILSIYYFVLDIEVPSRSFADFAYVAAIIAYVVGVYYLAKTVKFFTFYASRPLFQKLLVLLLPIAMTASALYMYFAHYDAVSQPFYTVTDIAVPVIQSIYAAMAIGVLLNSKELFGGKLRLAVLSLLVALLLQYAADFNFFIQNQNGTYVPGGYGDFLYMLSYSLMGMSILSFYIKEEKQVEA